MRQTLWAEQMIAHKGTERIKADDYIHIHIIPSENHELLHKKYGTQGMEAAWRSCINYQEKYVLLSPQTFLAPVDPIRYMNLILYLKKRYWE